ncbi:hypothetical protein [Candidatus Methylocalor cossyra]
MLKQLVRTVVLTSCAAVLVACVHRPEDGVLLLKLSRCTITPFHARPGHRLTVTTDYLVRLDHAMPQTEVEESWTLRKGDAILSNIPPQKVKRSQGEWETITHIDVPRRAKPGIYVVEHKIQSGTQVDSAKSAFIVIAR